MYGREEIYAVYRSEDLMEEDHRDDLGVNGRMVLK
jgi:hypothetical protein